MLRQKLSAVAPAQWLGPVKRQPLGWGSESGATERSWSAIIYAVRSTSRSSHNFPAARRNQAKIAVNRRVLCYCSAACDRRRGPVGLPAGKLSLEAIPLHLLLLMISRAQPKSLEKVLPEKANAALPNWARMW